MSARKLRKSPKWKFCVKYWDSCCAYCGERKKDKRLTVDHYIPQIRNGSNSPKNLVPACIKCNRAKSGQLPEEFCTMEQLRAIKLYFKALSMPNTLEVLQEIL